MANPPFVLVIAGDPLLRAALSEQVSGLGYKAMGDAGVAPPLAMPDILLVAGPPEGGDIPSLCRNWRGRDRTLPILVLTEPAEDGAALRDAGAHSTLAKPVRLAELSARLSAMLQGGGDTGLALGRMRFHAGARLVVDEAGERIRLTEKEAAILLHLHRADGKVVSRAELLDKVWGYGGAVDTHTVETHIYRLRRKLGDDRMVSSLEGGYRLNMPDQLAGSAV